MPKESQNIELKQSWRDDYVKWVCGVAITGATTKIGFFRTNTDLRFQDEIRGDLFTQVENALELLTTKYLQAGISYEGLQRLEILPVPETALRQALMNALVHKDYASGAPVQVKVFPDSLIIDNAGELPPEITPEKLMGKHPSRPYNPDVANAFYLAGHIESWGRGIEMMVQACEESGCPIPEIKIEAGSFAIEFRFVTGQVDQPTGQVTGQVQKLLDMLEGEMSRTELMKVLRLKHRDSFVELYIKPALALELIEMTVPDRPTSQLQKYRLTGAGKKLKG